MTDSPSMGELCHTKGSLRLPLDLMSSTSSEVSDFVSDRGSKVDETEAITIEITNDDESPKESKCIANYEVVDADQLLSDVQFSHHHILPTPSCTGSMDSLSSSSASSSSERGPPSFTTFGKSDLALNHHDDPNGRTSIIFIEDSHVETELIENQKNNLICGDVLLENKLTLTVGSSDEDSGFENISRLAVK